MMMTDSQVNKTLAAVREAGMKVVASLDGPFLIRSKGVANFVTEVDQFIEARLGANLQQILPGSYVVGEEGGIANWRRDRFCWVLDPIDGTTNFVHGYPHFAISVALYLEDQCAFGVVYNPIRREMFYARSGQGAWLNRQQIQTSTARHLRDCLIGFGLPYDRAKADLVFRASEVVFAECRDLRRSGSAALDLAYVACGRLDGYFEVDLRMWDIAAGALILSEAGGTLTDWGGGEILAATDAYVAATNGLIHHSLLAALQESHRNRPT